MPGPAIVLPSNGQVWRFWVEGRETDTNQQIQNGLFVELNATNPANPIGVTAAIVELAFRANLWRAQMLPVLGDTYFVDRYNLACITQVTADPRRPSRADFQYGGRSTIPGLVTDVGSRGTPCNPAFVTISAYYLSTVTSRFTRGGIRLSPTIDADLVGGTYTVAYATLVRTGLVNMTAVDTDVANNATWTPVICSAKAVVPWTTGIPYVYPSAGIFSLVTFGIHVSAKSEVHRKRRGFGT